MVEKYKAYPEYKDSGVKWLGKTPSNWSVIPLKRYFSIINGSTPKSGNDNFWNGDIIWITPSDLSKLTSFDIINSTRKITKSGLASCGTSIVPINSIILSCRAPIGSIGLAKVELCTNQGCKSLVPFQDSSSYFYAYVLSICTEELNAKGKGTTFLELSNDELGYFSLPKPTIKEQRNIVIFLDYETYKIDTLIKQQQQLIKLLEEKRQAVISQAVTKGLNPNVSMKDSGVEWLGEIPEHWVIQKAKYLFILQRGYDLTSHQFIEGEYPVYGSNGIIGYHNKYTTSAPSLTVGRSGSVGEINFINVSFWAHNTSLYLKETNDADMRFIFYLLKAMDIKSLSAGSAVGSLDRNNIHACYIAKPPLEEQIKIAQHLDRELLKLSSIEQKAKFIIIKLKERRTALISAAVTGKIDVRDWQAPKATD
ncbi:restriction endonuclease subunit S [Snodgrassella alvi]|uniref:restriction endonuclease subunit S n=1 Tax=Snodgrassella alvi TaxID=1196083 RepID=UPI003D055AD2